MRTHDRLKKESGDNMMKKDDVIRKVAKALDEVQYGEIVIKVRAGKPMFVDKYERQRVG